MNCHIHGHPFQSFEPNLSELVLVRHFARNPSSVPHFTESTPCPLRFESVRARIPTHSGAPASQRTPARDPLPRIPGRGARGLRVYPQMRRLLVLTAACALLLATPVTAAGEEVNKGNKFRQREASDDLRAYPHL
jgi:hypothetical protein